MDHENLLFFYSKSEITKKYKLKLQKNNFFFSLKFYINIFKKYNRIIISNTPIFINLCLLKYCNYKKIPITIIVDSILEPPHISLWPRWRKQKITGAFQLTVNNIIHPLSNNNDIVLPKEIYGYMKKNRPLLNLNDDITVGITISNRPASTTHEEKILMIYYEKIVKYLEKKNIKHLIRDRSDILKKYNFFKNRINTDSNQDLDEYLNSLTHLITVPGTLTLIAGLSKLHVTQVLLSNMFCNTPSTFVVTPSCEPKTWIDRFLSNKTINHDFQIDYYNSLKRKTYSNNLDDYFDNLDNFESENKFVFFNFIISLIYWNLRSFLKDLLYLFNKIF